MQLADFITFAVTRDADLVRELAEARIAYHQPEIDSVYDINRLRPCQADYRLRQYCREYINSFRQLPTEELVQRQCYRLGLRVTNQLRELRRGRYV